MTLSNDGATTGTRASSKRRFGGLLESALLSIALPFAAVQMLPKYGVSLVTALAISAVFPLVQTLLAWRRSGRLDALGIVSLVFIVLGVGASLLSGDARFALARGSYLTGLFALLCLGSLLAPRPLMFFLGRQFATGDDPQRVAEWNDRWQYPLFRRVMRDITAVWGIAYLVEAAARIVIVYHASASFSTIASPLLGYGTAGLCALFTFRYSKWAERRGAKLRAEREAVADERRA